MKQDRYRTLLYPLQDEILKLIGSLELPFYLTGGTALSRHYLDHRYSDDLDLFVNGHPDLRALVERVESCFRHHGIEYRALTRSTDFVRFAITGREETLLKLDLVNDVVPHIGGFETSEVLGRVDNVYNILSNKVSAIPRLEIKDFVDIIFIAVKYPFDWETIITDAMQKDDWVNPLDLARYFTELDAELFSLIPWVKPVDPSALLRCTEVIADEIIKGSVNSLSSLGSASLLC